MKLRYLVPSILFICTTGYGQGDFNYGAHFSIGTTQLSDQDNNNIQYSSKLYVGGGATASYMFNSLIGLQVEAGFGINNGASNGEEVVGKTIFNQDILEEFNDDYTLGYIKIPILAKLSLGNESFKFNVLGGASSNFNFIALKSRSYKDQNYDDDNGYSQQTMNEAETFVPSIVGGIGLQARSQESSWYFIDFRYESSLNSVTKIDNTSPSLNSYTISLGYLF